MIGLLYFVSALIFVCVGAGMALQEGPSQTALSVTALLLVFLLQVLILVTFGKLKAQAGKAENADAEAQPREPEKATLPPEPASPAVQSDGLVLASLLQEKGRFIDFVMDDVQAYSDAQVGAAARVVHSGCRDVIQKALGPEPIATSPEQQTITLSEDYDRAAFRVTGKMPANGAIQGKLEHKGWQASRCDLPKPTQTLEKAEGFTLAPAQISH